METLNWETNNKNYLTDNFLDKTDFSKHQYPLLREFLSNAEVRKEYSEEDIEKALKAENQELIGIYDEYYYNQYLKDYNNGIDFKAIPNGSFNHNNFGMYKSKDGSLLIEIQE